jgi:hypothetical protein
MGLMPSYVASTPRWKVCETCSHRQNSIISAWPSSCSSDSIVSRSGAQDARHGVLHSSSSNTASTVPLRTARASAAWSFSF